ncbi:MAG: hypothetical protein DRN04_10720 [Thermoprotei archaeon]|nr:MAG: hypothetical protein DRN04_10720 [Thermoprotei archaeon]
MSSLVEKIVEDIIKESLEEEYENKVAQVLLDIFYEISHRKHQLSYSEALDLVKRTKIEKNGNKVVIEVDLGDAVLRYEVTMNSTANSHKT